MTRSSSPLIRNGGSRRSHLTPSLQCHCQRVASYTIPTVSLPVTRTIHRPYNATARWNIPLSALSQHPDTTCWMRKLLSNCMIDWACATHVQSVTYRRHYTSTLAYYISHTHHRHPCMSDTRAYTHIHTHIIIHPNSLTRPLHQPPRHTIHIITHIPTYSLTQPLTL